MNSQPLRVLLAIDGSEPARVAVELVAGVAWPTGSEILVAEGVVTGPALFGGPWPAIAMVQTERIEAEIRAAAHATVRAARERIAHRGLSVEVEILPGRPATAIVDRARRMPADLIIVGSRGHGTIDSMILGSVSAEVVDHAASPVLVARGSQIKRIVLGWDGSSCASRAADLLRTWPIFAGSDVHVVSVADIEVPWWSGFPETGSPETLSTYIDAVSASRARHDELVAEMTAQLRSVGLAAEPDRREGDAATEILAAAAVLKADLIVVGTHGWTGLKRLVLGSVARNVLQHASCSVLIVRDRDPRLSSGERRR